MSTLTIQTFVVNMFQENCFVVYDDTREAIVIDPGLYHGEEEKTVRKFIDSERLIVKHLVNTHLHPDHIFGNAFIEKEYKVVTEAHEGDEKWLTEAPRHCGMLGVPWKPEATVQIGKYLQENDRILFGNSELTVLHVPGHSQGSICLYNEANKVLFSGDVLFLSSVGRTDLPGGSWEVLINGIRSKLLTLPEDTVVYCGHGPTTTIGIEKKNNPYL